MASTFRENHPNPFLFSFFFFFFFLHHLQAHDNMTYPPVHYNNDIVWLKLWLGTCEPGYKQICMYSFKTRRAQIQTIHIHCIIILMSYCIFSGEKGRPRARLSIPVILHTKQKYSTLLGLDWNTKIKLSLMKTNPIHKAVINENKSIP